MASAVGYRQIRKHGIVAAAHGHTKLNWGPFTADVAPLVVWLLAHCQYTDLCHVVGYVALRRIQVETDTVHELMHCCVVVGISSVF